MMPKAKAGEAWKGAGGAGYVDNRFGVSRTRRLVVNRGLMPAI
jgi:hypothetical protein